MQRYCVPIVYRGVSNIIVEARDPEEAKKKAEEVFQDGDVHQEYGKEFAEIELVGEPEEIEVPLNLKKSGLYHRDEDDF